MVLRHIHHEAPISRAQIAHDTGLNKSTVSSLVEALIDRKLIHEVGRNSTGTGRPARMLDINPRAGSIISLLFGVDFVSVALTNFSGEVFWRVDEDTDFKEEKEKILDQTIVLIEQAKAFNREQNLNLFGLGVAVPGIINLEKGELVFAPNLQWHNVPLQDFYEKETGLKVFIENDANAAAMSEHLFGIARQSDNFIFVLAGFGVGSGLFLNGALYRGNEGYAGEVGHTPIMVEPLETQCHCGNFGCWEIYANQVSILQRVENRLKNEASIIPDLIEQSGEALTISLVKQAADAGDAVALAVLKDAGVAMGVGLMTLVNILNPEMIIVGGPLSIVGEYLLPGIEQSSMRFAFPATQPDFKVMISGFKKDSSLIGAASVVVDHILSHPTLIERR